MWKVLFRIVEKLVDLLREKEVDQGRAFLHEQLLVGALLRQLVQLDFDLFLYVLCSHLDQAFLSLI